MRKIFIVLFILTILLYHSSFTAYFFQDDFYIMKLSQVSSVNDLIRFFVPHTEVQFYRPISVELFFWICRFLFGFRAFYYHVVVWVIFICNWFLVYNISRILFEKKKIAAVILILYATSAIHYNTLLWLSNFSYILVTTWFFLSFYILCMPIQLKTKTILISCIYMMGLLTNEFMLQFPLLAMMYILLFLCSKWKIYVYMGLSLVCQTVIYLYIRIFLYPPDVHSYIFEFNRHIISSYRFFFLYFLNWPETMKDNMLSYIKIRQVFFSTFIFENFIWIGLLLIAIIFYLITSYAVLKNKKNIRIRFIVFFLCWILMTLLPIAVIPGHIAPHHGSIALLGFIIILVYPYSFLNDREILLFPLLILWIMSSWVTISFDNNHHWILRRANISEYWIKRLTAQNVILVPTDEKEVKVALDDGEGFRQIHERSDIQVIFQKL